jgi:hypothetical protein
MNCKKLNSYLPIVAVSIGIVAILAYNLIWWITDVKISVILYWSFMIEIAILSGVHVGKYRNRFARAILVMAWTSHSAMALSLMCYYLYFNSFRYLPFYSMGLGLMIAIIYFFYELIKSKK